MGQVFVEYFKELEEESLRDNFIITYELLDEMMDFGWPQITEPKLLQEYVFCFSALVVYCLLWWKYFLLHAHIQSKQHNFRSRLLSSINDSFFFHFRYITQESHKLTKQQVVVPKGVTGAVSWRSDDVKYRKNEVFLDVIEKINLLVSFFVFKCVLFTQISCCNDCAFVFAFAGWHCVSSSFLLSFVFNSIFQVASNGTLLRSEIVGSVKMKSFLSGMPELRLGLNDRVQFESTGRGIPPRSIHAVGLHEV